MTWRIKDSYGVVFKKGLRTWRDGLVWLGLWEDEIDDDYCILWRWVDDEQTQITVTIDNGNYTVFQHRPEYEPVEGYPPEPEDPEPLYHQKLRRRRTSS